MWSAFVSKDVSSKQMVDTELKIIKICLSKGTFSRTFNQLRKCNITQHPKRMAQIQHPSMSSEYECCKLSDDRTKSTFKYDYHRAPRTLSSSSIVNFMARI